MDHDRGPQSSPSPCRWKEGQCPNAAEQCRYAHGDADMRSPLGTGMMEMNKQGQVRLHQMSFNGTCEVGEALHWSLCLTSPSLPPMQVKAIEVMKKTRLCAEFVNSGNCKYGVKCTFAHGEAELRTVIPGAVAAFGGGGGGGAMVQEVGAGAVYCVWNVGSEVVWSFWGAPSSSSSRCFHWWPVARDHVLGAVDVPVV